MLVWLTMQCVCATPPTQGVKLERKRILQAITQKDVELKGFKPEQMVQAWPPPIVMEWLGKHAFVGVDLGRWEAEGVSGALLVMFTDSELKEMGLGSGLQRMKVMAAVILLNNP
jgi:hypothetical protein